MVGPTLDEPFPSVTVGLFGMVVRLKPTAECCGSLWVRLESSFPALPSG